LKQKRKFCDLLMASCCKLSPCQDSNKREIVPSVDKESKPAVESSNKVKTNCEMCSKLIEGQPHVIVIGEKVYNFDCKEGAQTFKKFKSVYGEDFQ
jgi:hypothetical protein